MFFQNAVDALRSTMDPQNRVTAATDFRHASLEKGESVADDIRRIKRLFHIAHGGDSLTSETRGTILQGQLHGGLRYDVVKSPAVSGAQSYQELCLAARQEEKRVAELNCRQLYTRSTTPTQPNKRKQIERSQGGSQQLVRRPPYTLTGRKCYICSSPDHPAKQCKSRKQESRPFQAGNTYKPTSAKAVRSEQKDAALTVESGESDDPRQYMYSFDEDGGVSKIRVADRGSRAHLAPVQVQGVPAEGVIYTGANISIIGEHLLGQLATCSCCKRISKAHNCTLLLSLCKRFCENRPTTTCTYMKRGCVRIAEERESAFCSLKIILISAPI